MSQFVIVTGHLGKDPEIRYTPSGVPVTSFSVASSRKWTTDAGEKQEKTTWFRVTAWRKLAETCAEYLKKGRLVQVMGEVEASAYTDKEGNARASLELTANNVEFLGSREEGEAASAPAGRSGGYSARQPSMDPETKAAIRQAEIDTDEIPF